MPLPLRLLGVLCLALLVPPAIAPGHASEMRAEGMTFVGSSGPEREVVLHSRFAVFHPATGKAELTDVDAEAAREPLVGPRSREGEEHGGEQGEEQDEGLGLHDPPS